MSQYYFAVASLPMLSFDEAPPITAERFFTLCRDQMSPRDYRALLAARSSRPATPATGEAEKSAGRAEVQPSPADRAAQAPEPAADSGRTPANEVASRWRTWERSLRYELARARSQVLGREFEVDLEAPFFAQTIETARNALGQETPLAGEELLERVKFAYLDELSSGHYFDLESLIVYMLKLEILERKALFRVDAGTEGFKQVYEHIAAGQIEQESELDNDER